MPRRENSGNHHYRRNSNNRSQQMYRIKRKEKKAEREAATTKAGMCHLELPSIWNFKAKIGLLSHLRVHKKTNVTKTNILEG